MTGKFASPKRRGHHSPRAVKIGGRVRSGRPPSYEKQEGSPPPDLRPEPSAIFVDGRAYVTAWSPERRTKFNDLSRLAEYFGLVVHEVDPSVERPRRAWTRKRADLDAMELLIEKTPGIAFDKWVEAFLLGGPNTPPLLAAARKRATQALSRLYHDDRIIKRYDTDGNLILYVPEHAPETPQ